MFEFRPNIGANHEFDVVLASRYLADFFVAAARRNNHTWDPELTAAYAVAAYSPSNEGDPMTGYQGYVFSFD